MGELKFTNKELINATNKSLRKWKKNPYRFTHKCGFCYMIIRHDYSLYISGDWDSLAKGSCAHICPAGEICFENMKFWHNLLFVEGGSFNPYEKKQKQRIQKNIDWLNNYLEDLQK